jgi:hypothetical protein
MHLSGLRLLNDETWAAVSATTAVISNATEDKATLGNREMTVLSGRFEPSQFGLPFVPEYQRDVLLGTRTKQAELIRAMTSGQGIPDSIILCLRSSNVRVLSGESGGGRSYLITGPLALFDGLQRIAAALKAKQQGKGDLLRPLRVLVYVDTTSKLERDAFDQFNHGHTQVGTQVRMRNHLTASPAAKAIWSLVDPELPRTKADLVAAQEFPLFGRVQYDQNKGPNDLITLRMMLELATTLHGVPADKTVPELVNAVTVLAQKYGQARLVENVQRFFEFVHECYPFHGEGARSYHSRKDFLRGLALLFAEHEDFWSTRNPLILDVPMAVMRKLSKIKPKIIEDELDGGRQVAYHVMRVLVRQVDLGKQRENWLQPRQEV